MAERQRRFGFFRGRQRKVDDSMEADLKALASLSRIGEATTVDKRSGKTIGAPTGVSYKLIREISSKSEVIAAIIRRTVDDVLGNGYRFILSDETDKGNPADLAKLRMFFKMPNPEDMGDEWLESLVYDLTLYGDAYLELDGTADKSTNDGEDWVFGGKLASIWNVSADTVEIIPNPRLPPVPEMAYVQNLDGDTRRFAANKLLHIAKYKTDRGYGTSPLTPLLNTIAGHLNLSNYINEQFTGTLPKTILNVGDVSNAEMKTMLAMLEQQLSGGKSPFGLVAVNGGTGFETHRLIDSIRDGQHLDLLYYYREEICAVFGIPPMKLGWVQTGKMSNPEQQLEAWYDVVESYHKRIEGLINYRILPLLDVTDYVFKFNTIRPSKEKVMAEVVKSQGQAIASLRQEGVISINEARSMLGYEMLDEQEAADPFYLSPKLAINKGKEDGEPESEPEPEPEPESEAPEEAIEEDSDKDKVWF